VSHGRRDAPDGFPALRWLGVLGDARAHLSLSDEGDFVLAYVILKTA
jgi:phosphopantetheinyl transferase (holo-ACP synthase)